MKEIKLTNTELIALIDDEDYPIVSRFAWYIDSTGYAKTCLRDDKKKVEIRLHKLIMGTNVSCKLQIDHINRNRLDNRKENLRYCTIAENRRNRSKSNGISKYKGVSWDKERAKWYASIKYNYKNIYLGRHDNEITAAQAYDKKAKELFGEFAAPNFN